MAKLELWLSWCHPQGTTAEKHEIPNKKQRGRRFATSYKFQQIYENYPIKIPIAHGEGRYYANKEVISKLIENNQILFKYCDKNGNVNNNANPNGSTLNIAGICNKNRNVFGMMPHPERAADIEIKNTDGKILFQSILNKVFQ